MSDTETSREDRQLPASERRLAQAREQGQVPRSRDLVHVAAACAALAGVAAAGPWMFGQGLALVTAGLRFDEAVAREPAQMSLRLGEAAFSGVAWALPLLAVLMVLFVGATLLVGGWNFATGALAPKPERLDPVAGLGRLFDGRAVLGHLRLALVVAALLGVAGWYLAGEGGDLLRIGRTVSPGAGLSAGLDWLAGGLALVLGVCLAGALADVPLQLLRHHAELRMTREEMRQEHKESEGDPHVRGERRRRQREMSRGRMLAAVPAASVVVTNPTHFAVALHYDEATMAAPRIVAMGADHLAFRIREVAAASGVPTLEAPPLARALYRHGELDAEVPVQLYGAVAQVLAWVMRLRTALRPLPPPVIEVPQGLDPQSIDPQEAAR